MGTARALREEPEERGMEIRILREEVDNATRYAEKLRERYPHAIYIEFYEGSTSLDIKTYDAGAMVIMDIAREILQGFEKVDYSSNDPEEWFKQELEVIKNSINRERSRLYNTCRVFRADIYRIEEEDGYAAGYFIGFYP